MIRLLDRHRLISSTQSLNVRSSLMHTGRNLMQDPVLLALVLALVRSRKRVVRSSRSLRVYRSSVFVLPFGHRESV